MKKIQENRRRRCDDVSPSKFNCISPFGIPVYWYAIIIVSGIALAVWLSSREAVRVGLKEDDVFDFMLWGLPAAIVGARLYYVAFQWQDYVDNPIEIFFTRNGGLAIYGGLIGGDWRCFSLRVIVSFLHGLFRYCRTKCDFSASNWSLGQLYES